MARVLALIAVFASAFAAAGCAGLVSQPAVTTYDFGPQPAKPHAQRLRQPLLVHDVSAPAWMDSSEIYYRLMYQDAAQPKAYAGSRWVMPPAALLALRLRQQLAASSRAGIVQPGDGVRTAFALRVELDEFAQVFDAPGKSRAVIRIRASVLGNRSLVAQRSFSVEQPVATGDAEGGVRALIGAGDQAIEEIIDWTAQHVRN